MNSVCLWKLFFIAVNLQLLSIPILIIPIPVLTVLYAGRGTLSSVYFLFFFHMLVLHATSDSLGLDNWGTWHRCWH